MGRRLGGTSQRPLEITPGELKAAPIKPENIVFFLSALLGISPCDHSVITTAALPGSARHLLGR